MSTIAKQNYKGRYHFSPEKNWMNDPNGLVYFAGEYHLFYQYYPHGTTHGPMHWGHAVSEDLVHWEELDIALFPDENGTIFSGSAVVDWGNTTGFFGEEPGLVAIFTHHLEAEGKPPVQTQSIAYSKDKGRTWTKYAGNPVLRHERFVDFRDPKVFWHEGTRRWVMILACGQTVCLYHSPDLKTWTFASEFGSGIGFHEAVWECPDLFRLAVDGDASRQKWVMLVSVGDHPAYAEGSRTQYFTGEFDGVTFTPDEDSRAVRWLDYGRDNYAGVSWSDIPAEDGRRLLIGWMSNWKYAQLTPAEEFRGAMTVPRELALESRNGATVLTQRPARELARVRRPVLSLANVAAGEAEAALRSLRLDSCELVAEAAPGASFAFKVRTGAGQETVVGVNAASGEVYVDRTKSGQHEFHEQFRGVHAAKLHSAGEKLELRIFVDRASVEVFANDGEAVITDLIFPGPEATGLSLAAETDLALKSLTIYELAP
ncbi:glycoside hydrolase family 32 protein [Paenibacillus macerans]|uniref:glycoside hydrolase family 32 protein n=2 Tax=Paenibacillus macerans TaxID=44252 RepID=UPI000EE5D481|nr:glycoside hydrolase family 32 protein [Paenibacillus macerans]GBK64644.1 glycoside hydrolase [Paenibacillus macerans]GBK70922.1 glycoside hydrolase [Paenibacillus macerans]